MGDDGSLDKVMLGVSAVARSEFKGRAARISWWIRNQGIREDSTGLGRNN